MTWSKSEFATLVTPGGCRALVLALAALFIAGCASTPDSGGGANTELTSRFDDAVALKKGGAVDQARSEFLAIHRAHPELAGPAANLGILAMESSDHEQARAFFKQAVSGDRPSPHALNALGVLAREQGDFDQAENYYRRALEAQPDFEPAVRNLAILLELYRGQLAEALVLVERLQSIQTEPDPAVKSWIFDLENRIN